MTPIEVIGIDHIYLAVSDMQRSERFYDNALLTLGFRKNSFDVGGDGHVQYFNRFFGYVLRPAKLTQSHSPFAPGLHHLCLRVDTVEAVHAAARALRDVGVSVTEPQFYPQYAPDYVAIFLSDPDGIRLEITNYRQERRNRHDNW
jgi:glyoxylase I family protein